MSKRFILLSAIALGLTLGLFVNKTFFSTTVKANSTIKIPSLEEELKNGYPTNENGETYGLTYGDNMEESPDLELAENEDGVLGYIRNSEAPGAQVNNPVDAMEYMRSRTGDGYYVNMYLEDGKTVVGKFWVSKSTATEEGVNK